MTTENKEVKVERKAADVPEVAQDQPVYRPATDIYEKPDALLIVCDLPGVDEKNVDVTLESDVLTITGHQDGEEPEGHDLLYRGFRPGVFRRSFMVSADIDHAKITAGISNGVLEVVLPKAAKAQPRKIAVQAG